MGNQERVGGKPEKKEENTQIAERKEKILKPSPEENVKEATTLLHLDPIPRTMVLYLKMTSAS